MYKISGKIKDNLNRCEWITISECETRKSAHALAKKESLKDNWIETDLIKEDDSGINEHCFYKNGKKQNMGL